MRACVRPKSQSLALRSKSMITYRSVFREWIPRAVNLLACLHFILAASSTSAKQHSCSSGHDGQREVICCEGNSPGTWPIRVEAGGHCYVLVLRNFALLDCNWSNKKFKAHCETCRGLDKNGLTHQADMLWLCGLRRMKPKPSQAHSFKYFCWHKCTCHIAQAKSPLQRPDKAGGPKH